MSFLAPFFFLALAGLAAPVIIHLIQRERRQVIAFPSLMFLRRIPYQSVRRRSIRNWLLLLLRLAALFMIIAAFARPYVPRGSSLTGGGAGAREVVILLDRSYSMGYGTRWSRAQTAARDAVRALGANDRATLISFGRGADADVRSTTERGGLLAAIGAATPTADVTRYGPALKLAQSVLEASRLLRFDVIVISDFQKNGWKGAEGVHFPAGTTVTPVVVGDAAISNIEVASAAFQRTPAEGQGHERITASAVLVRRGGDAPAAVQLVLQAEGREIEKRSATIAPNASATVSFAPFTLYEPFTAGSIRMAASDALAADDGLNFVLSPTRPVSILLVGSGGTPAESSLYLRRALGIGTSPVFKVDETTADRLGTVALDDRSLLVFNDAVPPSGLLDRLRQFVEKGGGVLFVVGARTTDAAQLTHVTIGRMIERPVGQEGILTVVDYSHPVYELFKTPRSGDFATARFFRYRALNPSGSGRVLARFDDGAPALVEERVGRGRVMLWPAMFETSWTDLPLKPIFLPFIHQLSTYLASYRAPAPWLSVGQVVDATGQSAAPDLMQAPGATERGAQVRVAMTPSGQRVPLDPSSARPAWLELAEPGVYEIRTRGLQESRPLKLAANVDVSESDLTAMEPQELVAAVNGRGPTTAPSSLAGQGLSREDEERQQGLWWFLLVGGIVLLAIETILSNRLSVGVPAWRRM